MRAIAHSPYTSLDEVIEPIGRMSQRLAGEPAVLAAYLECKVFQIREAAVRFSGRNTISRPAVAGVVTSKANGGKESGAPSEAGRE